jgi:glycosyltransferase involved in cell wall biosynthesis
MRSTPLHEALISVIAPLEGEGGAAIEAFVEETIGVVRDLVTHYEIILVDDGTSDDTRQRVQAILGRHDFVRFLTLSRHFGEETAIAAGLDAAIGDYVIVMLPNMDPPALIPRFFERVRSNAADLVYGVRLHRKNEPAWYRLGAAVFYGYVNGVIRAGLPRDSTQFRCMTRQVVNAITRIRDPESYLRVLTSYVGFRKEALPYAPINRNGRATVRPTADAFHLARSLTIDYSTQPLRFVAWLAVLFALVLTGMTGWQLANGRMDPSRAREIDPLMFVLSMQFLIVTVVLAAIAAYVASVARRTRGRPAYYVQEEHTSSVLLREERRNVVSETVTQMTQSSQIDAERSAAFTKPAG